MKNLILLVLGLSLMVACGRPSDGQNGAPGSPGEDGYTSLVSMNSVTVTADICASLSGLDVSAGLDLNRDLVLNEEEITQTTILCNGYNGEDGEVVYVDCHPRKHKCKVVGH